MVRPVSAVLRRGQEQLSALQHNQSCVLLDFAAPHLPALGHVVCWQGVYYVLGPLAFELFAGFDLYQALHLPGGPVLMAANYNDIMRVGGAPPEAYIFECGSVEDVLRTLDALLEAYELTL